MNKYVQWGIVWLLAVIAVFVILCYRKLDYIYNITLIWNWWETSIHNDVKDILTWVKNIKDDMEFYYMHS